MISAFHGLPGDSSPLLPREPGLPELGLANLAVRIAGQLVDELHDTRPLVVGELLAAERDHAVGIQGRARSRLHDRIEDLAPPFVRHTEYGAVDDVRVLVQGVLDLARIDV